MAISLWELRKRPVPREVLCGAEAGSPSMARVSDADDTATKKAKSKRKERKISTEWPRLACSYRLGTCARPRTLKTDGSLHSLCAVHRDRSIANQLRYDAKKRRERDTAPHAQEEDARRQRKLKHKARLSKRAREKPRKAAPVNVVLPSFREFTSALRLAPSVTGDVSPRAWLGPFNADAACSSSAWRDIAVAQFLFQE